MNPTVVGLGEILWDMLPDGKQPGGAPANFLCHTRSLGAQAFMVSAVGDDELGKDLRLFFENKGIDTSFMETLPDAPTGTVDVKLDEKGSPTYTINEGVAWDRIPCSPKLDELARKADCVCFGSLAQRMETSRRTIQRFLDRTRPECLKIYDVNLRQNYYNEEILRESIEKANVLKLNEDEAPIVARALGLPDSPAGLVDRFIHKFNLRVVALTMGEKGASLTSKAGESWRPGEKVERLVDSVGAGDSFTAALAMGLLKNKDLCVINEWAARIAAFVCSQPGGVPRLPDELIAWIRS